MMWAIPVAMAAMSAIQAKNKADQQERYNRGQAEMTKYSPWTGVAGKLDYSYNPSMLEGGVSGGIQGMGVAQGMQGLFSSGSTATTGAGSPYSLGADQFSNSLASQGRNFEQQMSPYMNMKQSNPYSQGSMVASYQSKPSLFGFNFNK